MVKLGFVGVLLGLPALSLASPVQEHPQDTSRHETIHRDVAIIGGCSSGTFAAIRLHDCGKSVVVIEKEPILGGHTNTYHDAATNKTIDYGVVVFHNTNITKSYFNRLGVDWHPSAPGSEDSRSNPLYLDPFTAERVSFTPPNPRNALEAYAAQVRKYPSLANGFFLPDPVPADLLLPFREFEKYPAVGDAVYTTFNYGKGLGDFLNQPTLYVFMNFGLGVLAGAQRGFLQIGEGNNHAIYDRAAEILGSDVLTRSQVVATPRRGEHGPVEMIVDTPTGRKTVRAKKLLVAMPQTIRNMIPLDVDGVESSVFGEFMHTGYYTSLVRGTCLPANFSVSTASKDAPFHIPELPGVYAISPTRIPGIFDVKYGSPHGLPVEYVKREILSYVVKLREMYGEKRERCGEPEFVAFNSHAPFAMTVSAGRIGAGFYSEFYGLQGYRGTWYTGAALDSQDSSVLWGFTKEVVLPSLVD